jgi:hypothetical protein
MEEWRYSSTILHLRTRWRWRIKFLPQSFNPLGSGPRYPLRIRLGGPQGRSGLYGEEKSLLPLLEVEPWFLRFLFCRLVTLKSQLGRTVAEAVSRCLPTAAAWVRVRAACGICGGQSGAGTGFLRLLRFPLPIIISPVSPYHNHPGLAQ